MGIFWSECKRVAEWISALLIGALFVVVCAQIFSRYAMGSPLGWTTEASVVLFVWIIFWNNAFIIPVREHVSFDIVYHYASPRIQKVFRIVTYSLVTFVVIWSLPSLLNYFRFLGGEVTGVIGLGFQWAFLPFFVFILIFPFRLLVALFARPGDSESNVGAVGESRTN